MQETQETGVRSLGWKVPWSSNWQSAPVFLPGKSHAQRSLAAAVHVITNSQTGLSDWPHPVQSRGTGLQDLTEGNRFQSPAEGVVSSACEGAPVSSVSTTFHSALEASVCPLASGPEPAGMLLGHWPVWRPLIRPQCSVPSCPHYPKAARGAQSLPGRQKSITMIISNFNPRRVGLHCPLYFFLPCSVVLTSFPWLVSYIFLRTWTFFSHIMSQLSIQKYLNMLNMCVVKEPAMREIQVWLLGQEDPLEKGMATHSSILAWRIPWAEEPDRLQSMGFQESDMT